MFVLGLTGGIATGKSSVSRLLRSERSLEVLDADEIAREVVQPGKPAYRKIVLAMGNEVVAADGQLDRDRLGQIVFADAEYALFVLAFLKRIGTAESASC